MENNEIEVCTKEWGDFFMESFKKINEIQRNTPKPRRITDENIAVTDNIPKKSLPGFSDSELEKICTQILNDFQPIKDTVIKRWSEKSFKLQLLYRVSLNQYFIRTSSKQLSLSDNFEQAALIDAEERLALLWYCAPIPEIDIDNDMQLSEDLQSILDKMAKLRQSPLIISADTLKEKLRKILMYYLSDVPAARKIEPQYNFGGDFLPANSFIGLFNDAPINDCGSLYVAIDPFKTTEDILVSVRKIIEKAKSELPGKSAYSKEELSRSVILNLKSLCLIPYFFYQSFKIYSPVRFTLEDFVKRLPQRKSKDFFETIRKNTAARYRDFCSMRGIQKLRYSLKQQETEKKKEG